MDYLSYLLHRRCNSCPAWDCTEGTFFAPPEEYCRIHGDDFLQLHPCLFLPKFLIKLIWREDCKL